MKITAGKKMILLALAGVCLTGCSKTKSTLESGTIYQDKDGAYEVLQTAVQNLQEESGVSLQIFGSLTAEYNDNTSMIGISSLYQEEKAEQNKVYSVFTMSYTDGTYVDYYNLSDGETNICQYGVNNGQNKSTDESEETAATATASTEEARQSGINILDGDEFKKLTAYGEIQTPFRAADIDSVTCIQSEDSDRETWQFSLNKEGNEPFARWLLESISYVDTDEAEIEFEIQEAYCQAVYDEDGELYSIKYSVDTDMTCEGETVSVDYKVSYIIVESGDGVKVELADLSQYETHESN